MESEKDYRKGKKARLRITASRKSRSKLAKKSSRRRWSQNNKENICPVLTTSTRVNHPESYKVSVVQETTATIPSISWLEDWNDFESDVSASNNTPNLSAQESFRQMVVEADIHHLPCVPSIKHILPSAHDSCKLLRCDHVQNQINWDVIETDASARSISNSSAQESFRQMVVEADIHHLPCVPSIKHVLPSAHVSCKLLRRDHIQNQSNWDVIETDASARNSSNSFSQEDILLESPLQEYNKSSTTGSEFYELQIETNENTCHEAGLEGNRIVNIAHLFNQLKSISHKPFNCNFQNFEFIKERRTGFFSEYIFKCRMCNKVEILESQKSNRNIINLNAIEGVSQTGNGWSQLDEICASLDIPNMSETYYVKNYKKISKMQKDIALQLMLEAGAEERRLALEDNEIDSEGIPYITVVTDGSWAKRSYGTNFNSLSGVGCIIGLKTKKVLYIGVKNSYCCVCAVAQTKKKTVPKHDCFQNWSGPSTEMETSAIVDGFKLSLLMHGIKYTKVIGDGDSSVMNALRNAMVYGPNIHIKKIECSNHLLRNYSNKLRKIAKKTENRVGFVPVTIRKALLDRVRRMYNAVTGAIAHARHIELPQADKIRILKEDLRNGPCHVFGWHDCCKQYYCKQSRTEENLVPQLKSSGMWSDIYENLGWLLQNVESLLIKETNNAAEHFFSIVAKFLAGKRVNFTRRGSYEARCFSAVGHYNSKDYSFLRKVQNSICPDTIYANTDKYINKKKKILQHQRKRQATNKARGAKRAKRFKLADKHYGDIIEEPDMPQEIFEQKTNEFMTSLYMTADRIKQIEKQTIAQADSDLWIVERKKRITASLFGQICKMKDSTPCTSTLKTILYSTFTGNDATRYGKAHEATAIADFEKIINQKITPCGLFIDVEKPYLGASPDGLLGTDSIIEIKCPASASTLTPIEAIRLKKIKFCIETADGIKLKETHNYHYQVQGQLKITNRKFCYFVVWTPNGIEIDKIEYDPTFWSEEKMSKLEKFYFKCLLPELIDPRFPRKLQFRDRF